MGHTLLCKLEFILVLYSLLHCGLTQDPVLTFEPQRSTYYIGESLTFKCDMREGGTNDWEYILYKRGHTLYDYYTNPVFSFPLNEHHSGDYQCCVHWKGSSSDSKCSNRVFINLSADKPKAKLTAGTTTVSVGDRVTLICSVEKSAGWKYEWFRRTSYLSEYRLNDGENGEIRVSQGGIYSCRGFRGEPAFYSDTSDEVNINITFSNKVIVTQKPSWSQMFRGETITLTCEVQGGEGVQWEYQWRTPQSQTSWRNNKDWTITASISGEYSCKSRSTYYSYSSTNWSEALRLSVSAHKPKSELNMTKSPVEGRVNMSCLVKNSSSGWRFFWFRGEKSSKLLTTQDADFLSNGQISVSQEGVYRCRGGRGEPVYHSEFSDPVIVDATSRPVSSSFPVLVFVLTSVILVILIFLIWFFCRRSRDSKMISRSQDNNQITAADHTEGQHRNDDVLLHGPEGIQNDPEDENTSESRMVTYSSIKFKTFNKKKKRQKPAENSVYSDVKTGASADVSQLYAEVKKKNKGKSSQSVDEMIYSEVQ